jgi:outer membrane protein OmpA-like peptidoglycan-associated protein
MKKFLTISMLCGLTGCASIGSLPFMGPPPVTSPATPVFFQPLSAALDAPALSTISSVAKAANNQPDARIIVTGAADNVGSAQANKYLSEARAQMVADALAADGISSARIRIRGVGTAPSPAAPGMPAQSARRVLIQLQG